VARNVDEFLKKHALSAESVDFEKVLSFFFEEMDKGLEGKDSSLEMIPTYATDTENAAPGQSVIVLDAGGTNFRTCLVTFDEDLKPVISDFRKVPMPGVEKEVSAAEFFSVLADNVERLIDKSDRIGFCFSYAANITKDHDGIPIVFSKEVKAPEVIGRPVGKCLLAELERRGHDCSKKTVSVVNDTVATLLAAKAGYKGYASGYVGFILGTGTNTAYTELNENIKKIDYDKEGGQIINVESGNLKLRLGRIDDEFMATTKNSEVYFFEKKISGAYLGPFAEFVINRAIEEDVFSSDFAERFAQIEHLNTTRMSNYLEMPHNEEYDLVKCVGDNEDDAVALYMILDSIIERAAKLTAVNLTAAVLKGELGVNPRYPALINADGTTFYKTEKLREYTEYYLIEYLQKKYHRYSKMVRIDDSPVLGAAIAGLCV
jgi:Hexokinase